MSGPCATPRNDNPAPGGSFAFPGSSRIRKRTEFRRVYDQGSRVSGSLFTLYYLFRGDAAGPRAGFTTPKALGKATVRNRIRRRMREAVRLEQDVLPAGFDLVYHARRGALLAPFDALRQEVRRVAARCKPS